MVGEMTDNVHFHTTLIFASIDRSLRLGRRLDSSQMRN